MNFDLDGDDLALQAAIRDVCRRSFPIERVRAPVDAAAWRTLGDAGVFSITLPEDDGGAGLGTAAAVLVFEELGRALVPGPLVASFLAAGLIEGAASGERPAGLIEAGSPPFVLEHHESVSEVLLLDPEGVRRIDAAAISGREPASPLDPLTPFTMLESVPRAERIAGPDVAGRLLLHGAALTAALALGIASATTEAATAYAKERVQFGRAIGSFQAIKHLLADMLVRAEVARAAVYAAGCMLDDPASGDAATAVASAKLLACEAALVNAKTSIQVHGGMGFTWEVDAHLFVKRAAVLATHFGGSGEHALTTAATLT